MNRIDEAMDQLVRSGLPAAERFAEMERRLFADLHADARDRSFGRAGIAVAATLALLGGLMAGAIGPRPAEASVSNAVALAPSTLLVGE